MRVQRFSDEKLIEIAAKTTASSGDNAAVVLPLVYDLQEARKYIEKLELALTQRREMNKRAVEELERGLASLESAKQELKTAQAEANKAREQVNELVARLNKL